jgi:hypothetical protein
MNILLHVNKVLLNHNIVVYEYYMDQQFDQEVMILNYLVLMELVLLLMMNEQQHHHMLNIYMVIEFHHVHIYMVQL